MIGKGKSITHTQNTINYIQTRDKAIELDRNLLIGETSEEMASEFKIFQNLNQRCKNNALSFVISPSIEDGNKLTNANFRIIAQDFLKKAELQNNQYVVYLHQEKAHKHIHIVVNRIDENGIAYKDNFIGKKAQDIAEQIARTRNLEVARDIQISNEKMLREKINRAHKEILKQNPGNIYDYADMMEKHGIKTHLKQAKDGKVIGIKFQIGDKMIKGSSVDKLLSAMNIQKALLSIAKNLIKQTIKSITMGI